MSVIKFIAYLAMFIIKEIFSFKTYINNLFILIKKQKKVYLFFLKKKTLEIFLDKNINRYIRLNSKIWKKSKKLNTESEKKVLIESLINHPQYLIINCIIGLRLALFHNLDCVGMIRRGDLISEKIMKSFGIKEVVEIDYGNFFSRLFFFLKGIKILGLNKKTRELIDFKIDNIEIGKNVYESYVRYQKNVLPNKLNFSLYYFLSKILHSNYLINQILDKKKYIYLVQAEKQFMPFRILFQNALKRKIIIYTRYGSENLAVRRYNNFNDINSNRAKINKKIVKFYYKNYKSKILLNFKNNLRNNLINNIGSEIYQKLNKNKNTLKIINNKKEICKLFNWKIEDPIVLVLSHNLVDGNFLNKWNLFVNNQEWLEDTLKVINKTKNVNWIIKPHPSEKIYSAKINTKDIFNKIIDYKNKNIKLFPINYSVKNFYKFIDIVVTSHGTAGYQYPPLGKTVIVCGDTYYSGHGFNVEPKTKKKYFFLLRNINKIKPIKISQVEKSIIFSYVFKIVTKVKIPTIYNSDITMNYDQTKFWRESYKLLKRFTNKKSEKNFYKSLDFQFLKDNENLINLSKNNF
jgi:hypothetical protein